MKSFNQASRAALILAFLVAGPAAQGYEQPTHVVLSQQAFNLSVMQNIPFQFGLGAFAIGNTQITTAQYADSAGTPRDLYALVQVGAVYEDNGKKSLNHFFNPINNTPLPNNLPGIAKGLLGPISTSPDWAIEDNGQISGQDYSYADARKYYWNALIAYDPSVRATQFGMMYESLGHVIHHIQDMAQPQHARDEDHCPLFWKCFVAGGLFDLYHPSLYEGDVLDCTANPAPPRCPPVYGAATYPAVFDETQIATPASTPFHLPRDFWTNDQSGNGNGGVPGKGMAEYTNAGFIGPRTNFTGSLNALGPSGPTLPLPSGANAQIKMFPLNDPTLYGPGNPFNAFGSMTFIMTPVTDYLRPDQSQATSRTSTYSMFAIDLSGLGQPEVFSYNDFNVIDAANLLIPRAIGYSAGLLNYFFRGKIGVSLPHEGVYGIVDHAAQYGPSTSTVPSSQTQGFRTIKAALTNASPDGEAMAGGTLAAVVKFRRNLNYTDALTMEPGSPGVMSLTAERGASDEIVVASAVFDAYGNPVAPGTVALSSTPQEFSFQFTNELLPLNATDVYLQIVWNGTLGVESNAVVATTIDISEPTYVSVFNSSDYISVGGYLKTRLQLNTTDNALLSQIRPQSCVDNTVDPPQLKASCFNENLIISASLDANNAGPSATNMVWLQSLPAQRFAQVVVLTDAFGTDAATTTTLKDSSSCNGGLGNLPVPALNNEFAIQANDIDYTANPIVVVVSADVAPLTPLRGINTWAGTYCVWDGDQSSGPSPDPSGMAALTNQSIFPVPLDMLNFPQNLPTP